MVSQSPLEKVRVFALGPDDIPALFRYSPGLGCPGVKCMVCGQMIDISGKERQYVVKCNSCREATPIRVPPGDKKFVRCVCHCLLICKMGALRIVCPRENCHRVLDIVKPVRGSQQIPRLVGMVRVTCAFCQRNFVFNTVEKKLAVCPHCKRTSAVGKQIPFQRGLAFLIIGLLLFITSIITTVETYREASVLHGLYTLYVGLFAGTSLLCLASIYFFTLKESTIFSPY